jgi:hypothetical protein
MSPTELLNINIFAQTKTQYMKQIILLLFIALVFAAQAKAQINDQLIIENEIMQNKATFPNTNHFMLLANDSTENISFADKTQNFIEKAFKYFPLPFGGYATETSWVLGITKYNAWKFKSTTLPDSLIQPSSILAYVYYTGEQQYKFYLDADLMHHSNKFNSQFEFLFLDYPSLYFGLGNKNEIDSGYLVDYKNLMISPTFYYNVHEKIYIGAKYTFNNFIDVKNLVSNSNDSLIELNEGIQSGLGFHMYREARDNRIRARKGSYLNVSYDYYGKYLGSDFDYGAFMLDYRKYISPIPQLTIAGQFFTELTHGDVPIQSMPVVGGAYMMRGVYENRYRDKQMLMAQLELRFPLFWIISGATYASLGQVAPKVSDLRIDDFHLGYGAGFRILIDEATSSVLRFDFSFNKDGHSIFIGFNEAF